MEKWQRMLSDECGASAAEYAILAALIAGVVISTAVTVGLNVLEVFTDPQLATPLS